MINHTRLHRTRFYPRLCVLVSAVAMIFGSLASMSRWSIVRAMCSASHRSSIIGSRLLILSNVQAKEAPSSVKSNIKRSFFFTVAFR